LPISFLSPVGDHGASDGVGTDILGDEPDAFWKDHKSAKINAIRTRTMIEKADVVVAKFGEDYRQWNTALDVGYASAKGKPVIVLHPSSLRHPLKEVDAAAMAVAETPQQVAKILQYVVMKQDRIDS
jgi:YtoQ family protein